MKKVRIRMVFEAGNLEQGIEIDLEEGEHIFKIEHSGIQNWIFIIREQ